MDSLANEEEPIVECWDIDGSIHRVAEEAVGRYIQPDKTLYIL